MKSVGELLSHLHSLDVRLWADGDSLHYDAPNGTMTPALLAELRERKAEILTFLRRIVLTTDASLAPIRPTLRDRALPLSFAQQRLWFLDQLEPGNPTYNLPTAVRLTGLLNVAALEQSLNEVVRRHESLRTTFATTNGRPTQIIAPTLILPLPMVDLREHPESEREAEARRLAVEEAQRPFDLAHGPLVRAILLRLGEQEHVLLLTMHHIVSDGWSVGVLIREVAALYRAFSLGTPSPLPELPIQYADYALWQREWLQGEVLEKQLAYWRRQLADAPALLELPTDRPRPAMQSSRGASQSFVLPPPLSEALKVLSQQEGVTLFMTLLATFETLLSRYTGQTDIVVGSPIANRNRSELEQLIGFFVNTLALRTDLSGTPTFRELLGRVREVALAAYAHQDMPFEMLVDEQQPERDLSHTPLFQVMFVLQNMLMEALELPGLSLVPLKADSGTAMFDLTLSMMETEHGLVGSLEYSTDLFDAATITRLAEHFQTLLGGIVANPEQRISDLPLLTEAERHQLLVEWNNLKVTGDTQTEYPQDRNIHELFEVQAEQRPDAVAVVFPSTGRRGEYQHLTYRELNRRANQLAHHLRALGVGPEILVSICVERSLEMVVGLLGILKAGGAYVPLDPAYPRERLAFMLEDTRAPVLLTQQRLVSFVECQAHACPEPCPERSRRGSRRVICLDADWKAIAQESNDNPASRVTADNLAYVIYTSGSTGWPKGVLISHGTIANHCCIIRRYYQLTPHDRVLQFAPFSFDTSLEQILSPLIAGAGLVLRDAEMWTPPVFYQKAADLGLTVIDLPPAYWHQLAQEGIKAPEHVPELHIRLVIIGGDVAQPESLSLWQQTPLKAVRLLNAYGPTETTITATAFEVSSCFDETLPLRRIPIGRPLANRQAYILDRHGNPVPIGIPGELHIGGIGLARGYWNGPELTAEQFIPDPFTPSYPPPQTGGEQEGGARLYKTGDLARYSPDGNIEFLGRMDYQVKIRGFRVELGEVEAVLGQHPVVREAVVLARSDEREPDAKRLVAYVVPQARQELTVSGLRSFLQEKLPDYMIPSAFVMMEALPLLPSGKVDRRALPAPDSVRPELERAFVAPRTPVEEVLAGIWADVLGLKQVGVHDNFFELGGDSILSIQVIARANQAGIHLTPRQLFENQTITRLAAVTELTPATQAEQGLVTGTVPLTPIQHWFFEQNLADPHHFNQALFLQVKQPLKPALLEKALQHLLLHHDALRIRFEPTTSGWRQIHASPDGTVPLTQIDVSALSEVEQKAVVERAAAELQASLNLSAGPLIRVALFDLGPQQSNRLFIAIHHLVVDGVSWRILLEDLETVYRQLSQGKAAKLPPKTTSFKQWAERLIEHAQGEEVQRELDNWLTRSWEKISPLPVDYPGGVNTVASARTVSVSLNAKETQALLQEVPRAYRTQINDVLLTALAQALAQWTGEDVLLVDLEGHGREEISEDVNLSRTVGWFTSIFPVLLNLRGAQGLGDALKSVKEQLRRIPKRGINYGVLRYLSRDEGIVEGLQSLPQAEMSFNYLGQLDSVWRESSVFEPAPESSGLQSPRGARSHLLEINGSISEGRLQLAWTYSENLHRRSTIEGVAQGFVEALRALIAHCQSAEAGGFTPSDFPEAALSQKELDDLVAEFGEAVR